MGKQSPGPLSGLSVVVCGRDHNKGIKYMAAPKGQVSANASTTTQQPFAGGAPQQQPNNQEIPPECRNNTQQSSSSSVASVKNKNDNRIDIKVFVGRLPTSATEEFIHNMFQEFGDVQEVTIIRDKTNGNHKGSAFVKMASINDADSAICAMSNIRTVDSNLGPIQISYAVGEPERLGFSPGALTPGEATAKVFVGSLPRGVSDEDVVSFFSAFGKCHDPYLMRDPNTQRFKGCGFIKFAKKEDALRAIKVLHGVATFTGANRPLELRIAEPKRTPGAGGQQIQQSRLLGWQHGSGGGGGYFKPRGSSNHDTYQHQPHLQQSIPQLNANPRSSGLWKEYFTADGRPYYHNCHTMLTQWEVPKEFMPHSSSLFGDGGGGGGQQGGGIFYQRETDSTGPPGANIFVFHVPNEWVKEDLAANFAQFGNVVSATVAMDHLTQRNKGYGFVSYDNIRSAIAAVESMNLQPAGNKRLRVAIKNSEEIHARAFAEQHGISFPTARSDGNVDGGGAGGCRPLSAGGNMEQQLLHQHPYRSNMQAGQELCPTRRTNAQQLSTGGRANFDYGPDYPQMSAGEGA